MKQRKNFRWFKDNLSLNHLGQVVQRWFKLLEPPEITVASAVYVMCANSKISGGSEIQVVQKSRWFRWFKDGSNFLNHQNIQLRQGVSGGSELSGGSR